MNGRPLARRRPGLQLLDCLQHFEPGDLSVQITAPQTGIRFNCGDNGRVFAMLAEQPLGFVIDVNFVRQRLVPLPT